MSINVTTNDILVFRQEMLRLLSDPSFMESYMEGVRNQKLIEENWLSKYTSCSYPAAKSVVLEHLATLDPIKLKSQVGSQFYNAPVMQAAACIAESFTIADDTNQIASNERIKEYISNLKKVGSPSVMGYAMVTDLANPGTAKSDDFFIVKAPQSTKNVNLLQHECAIAFFGTNILRSIIPNFAYIYATFKCSPPIIGSENKKVLAWCDSITEGAVSYAVYENITPAISFREYCKKCSINDYMHTIVQICCALKIAHRERDFTHYDLHDENVLIRSIPGVDTFLIQYDDFYIRANSVATIIDFGQSHIAVRSEDEVLHLGDVSGSPLIHGGIFRDRSNIAYDIYKLLTSSLIILYHDNPSVYEDVKSLLSFFNQTESPVDILKNQHELTYILPYIDEVLKFKMDDFIKYCITLCNRNGWLNPIIATPNPTDKILQCTSMCRSFNDSLREAGVDLNKPPHLPDTLFEFFDIYNILLKQYKLSNSQEGKTRVQAFSQAFSKGYTSGTSKLQAATLKEVQNMDNLISQIKPFNYYELPSNFDDIIHNDDVLEGIKTSTEHLASYLEVMRRLATSLKVLNSIIITYNLKVGLPVEVFNKYMTIFQSYTPTNDDIKNKINNGLRMFNPSFIKATPMPGYSRFVQFIYSGDNKYKYEWLLNIFITLNAMFSI